MARRDQDMSVAESLGAFVGAIWGGIASRPGEAPGTDAPTAQPHAPQAQPPGTAEAAPAGTRTVATRVEDRTVDGVILRRTTIDEVIVPDPRTKQDTTSHATH